MSRGPHSGARRPLCVFLAGGLAGQSGVNERTAGPGPVGADVGETCGPLRSPTPAVSPQPWLHCVFLSSGRPCLHWPRPVLGRGGPSPPSFSLGALAGMLGPQTGQGVKAVALTSFHHRSSPPRPWAQLALATLPGSELRMDPDIAGAGSPQTQEDAGSLQIAPLSPTWPRHLPVSRADDGQRPPLSSQSLPLLFHQPGITSCSRLLSITRISFIK